MIVSVSTSGLKHTRWYEYLIRFGLGGFVTAVAALLAKEFGPGFGGLFLAFPAVLAASTTLVEKHECERKHEKGLHGRYRGRQAAGADAAGAAMGSAGLITFAVFVWKFLPARGPSLTLVIATLIWAIVSGLIWWTWKRNYPHRLLNTLAGPSRHKRRR
jgi:hypothetical protein